MFFLMILKIMKLLDLRLDPNHLNPYLEMNQLHSLIHKV
jgi:hypothetical protein